MLKKIEFTSTKEQATHIRHEFAELMADLADRDPAATPRTWGFEVETPEADKAYRRTNRTDLDEIAFCQDGSVSSSEGCECDCRSCSYHTCDCDDCENYNEDPDHDCGSSECCGEYQEIKSIGGLSGTHPEALAILDRIGLDECEITAECGLHIHIATADLSPIQLAKVQTAYRLAEFIFDAIAGRAGNYYYQRHNDQNEDYTRKGNPSDKYTAVNTKWHFEGPRLGRPQTVEFRQHEGTNDTARIRAWAWLLIRLVEFAKTDRPVYWVGKSKTLSELVHALRP
jgi:hypothetical protein